MSADALYMRECSHRVSIRDDDIFQVAALEQAPRRHPWVNSSGMDSAHILRTSMA